MAKVINNQVVCESTRTTQYSTVIRSDYVDPIYVKVLNGEQLCSRERCGWGDFVLLTYEVIGVKLCGNREVIGEVEHAFGLDGMYEVNWYFKPRKSATVWN